MDRSLDSLDPRFQMVAMQLLARLVEAGIPVMITNTRRTDLEQAQAIATGHSQVQRSKHQDGLAIDVCPYDVYQLDGPDKLQWDRDDPVWPKMGVVGEHLGLRWGGRFHPLDEHGLGWDPGHFEYVEPATQPATKNA
jgi:hypothetical protein